MTSKRKFLLSLSAAAIIAVLGWCAWNTTAIRYLANDPWDAGARLPFSVRGGIEVASNGLTWRYASLSLVCSGAGDLRMVLVTRLPGPRNWEANGRWRDEASLFVAGFAQQAIVGFAPVAKAHTPWWMPGFILGEGFGLPDIFASDVLAPDILGQLEHWFSTTPPDRVDIVGIAETGVFMEGDVNGRAIRQVRSACVPTQGDELSPS